MNKKGWLVMRSLKWFWLQHCLLGETDLLFEEENGSFFGTAVQRLVTLVDLPNT